MNQESQRRLYYFNKIWITAPATAPTMASATAPATATAPPAAAAAAAETATETETETETANATAMVPTMESATATAMAMATATIDSYLRQTHCKYKPHPLVLTSFNVDNRHLCLKHCKYKSPHTTLLAEAISKIRLTIHDNFTLKMPKIQAKFQEEATLTSNTKIDNKGTSLLYLQRFQEELTSSIYTPYFEVF